MLMQTTQRRSSVLLEPAALAIAEAKPMRYAGITGDVTMLYPPRASGATRAAIVQTVAVLRAALFGP
jgi:hypothetical protein